MENKYLWIALKIFLAVFLIGTVYSWYQIKSYEKSIEKVESMLISNYKNQSYILNVLFEQVEKYPSEDTCNALLEKIMLDNTYIEVIIELNHSKLSNKISKEYRNAKQDYRYIDFIYNLSKKNKDEISEEDIRKLEKIKSANIQLRKSIINDINFDKVERVDSFAYSYITYINEINNIFK